MYNYFGNTFLKGILKGIFKGIFKVALTKWRKINLRLFL